MSLRSACSSALMDPAAELNHSALLIQVGFPIVRTPTGCLGRTRLYDSQQHFTDNKTNKELTVLARHQLRDSWRPCTPLQCKHRVLVNREKEALQCCSIACLAMYELSAHEFLLESPSYPPWNTIQHGVATENVPSPFSLRWRGQ